MQIETVVSFLGAWRNLQKNQPHLIEDMNEALHPITFANLSTEPHQYVRPPIRQTGQSEYETFNLGSPLDLHRKLRAGFSERGWQNEVRLSRATSSHRTLATVDLVKDGVGLELGLGKEAFIESRLFVGFPRFVRAGIFQTAIALIPMRSLAKKLDPQVARFEEITAMLQELVRFPLNYPFAVVGFSEDAKEPLVRELTSELDAFLIERLGTSLEDMVSQNEQPNYDFKQDLPRAEKLAKEVCGFANTKDGGYLIIGIDQHGSYTGVPKGQVLDDVELRITNTISDNCTPKPRFEFFVFGNPENPKTTILVTKIHEIERKPCMTQGRVYVRSGPSVRAADAEEIRRLVLG